VNQIDFLKNVVGILEGRGVSYKWNSRGAPAGVLDLIASHLQQARKTSCLRRWHFIGKAGQISTCETLQESCGCLAARLITSTSWIGLAGSNLTKFGS